MLAIACVPSLVLILLVLLCKWRTSTALDQWLHGQLDVASFRFAGVSEPQQRLELRATANSRLKAAFGIDNSLTTSDPSAHAAFLRIAKRVLNKKDRNWEVLYQVAETFLQTEIQNAIAKRGEPTLPLAECVRCMCLATVMFDNFGTDPASIPREHLVTITDEINNQWLLSKRDPNVARSARLEEALGSLNLPSPDGSGRMSPAEVLSLLMPQYETLWRVVLLTFVTAYHQQPDAHADVVRRTADVPSCLGDPAREKEALKLAMASIPTPSPIHTQRSFQLHWALLTFHLTRKRNNKQEGLRLYPSNKHLYRSHPQCPSGPVAAVAAAASCDIVGLHRHAAIWGGAAEAGRFRPSRFDEGRLTARQRAAYVPFSVAPHRCPAGGASGFGNRIVTALVVALGRRLGPEHGRVLRNGPMKPQPRPKAKPPGPSGLPGSGGVRPASGGGGGGVGVGVGGGARGALLAGVRAVLAGLMLGRAENERGLPTGRDEMEEWVWEGWEAKEGV